jgi:hypothetical protein
VEVGEGVVSAPDLHQKAVLADHAVDLLYFGMASSGSMVSWYAHLAGADH